MLSGGGDGGGFNIFFDPLHVVVVYVQFFDTPTSAKAAIQGYKRGAAAGEMGYGPALRSDQLWRAGNVGFLWQPVVDSVMRRAIQHCLTEGQT